MPGNWLVSLSPYSIGRIETEPRCKEGEADFISVWEKGQTIRDYLFLNFHTYKQCAVMNGYISSPHQTQIISLNSSRLNDPAYK